MIDLILVACLLAAPTDCKRDISVIESTVGQCTYVLLPMVVAAWNRRNLSAPVAEGHITGIMGDMAARLLSEGYSVVVCAWNMEAADMALWTGLALKHGAPLVWLDVRAPEVEALIPPLQAA